MSVTCGFYNSLNSDRRYDAVQMSSIFDGIIQDGVLQHYGSAMVVRASSGMIVNVGIGRAWFNHTWTLNDALLPLTIPQAEVLMDRIDAVVIDVNASEAVRKNDIIVVKGTPSSNPVKPRMISTGDHWQYPLAYVRVNAGVTSIRQANITNRVGTSECPYVTAPLEKMNIDDLVAQWADQWNVFFGNQSAEMNRTNAFWKEQWRVWFEAQTTEIQQAYLNWEHQWDTWYAQQTSDMNATNEYWKRLWQSWFYDYINNCAKELAYWKKLVTEEAEETNAFWKEQWRVWFEAQTTEIQQAYLDWESQWNTWYASQTTEMEQANAYWKSLWQAWYYDYVHDCTQEYTNWKTTINQDFMDWWDALKGLLVGNPDANFALKLLDLENRVETLEQFMSDLTTNHCIYERLLDSSDDAVTDDAGNVIESVAVIFMVENSVDSAETENLLSVVKSLSQKIASLEEFRSSLSSEFTIWDVLTDGGSWRFSDNPDVDQTDKLLDGAGEEIAGRVIFVTK